VHGADNSRPRTTKEGEAPPMDTDDNFERLLTVKEVGAILGVNDDTVRRLVAKGHLKAIRVGRLIRFKRADIEALLDPQWSGALADACDQFVAIFGLRPRRACLVPFAARSATSSALTSRTTTPRRASAYLIVRVAASFSSIAFPLKSLTTIVFRATESPSH
jgi:excisionase family DNA binding protein